jgi:hypothetical protein
MGDSLMLKQMICAKGLALARQTGLVDDELEGIWDTDFPAELS